MFLGGATSLCLHLLRKLGGTHILNCALVLVTLVHHKRMFVSQNYHISVIFLCVGMCWDLFPLISWGSGQIAPITSSPICLKVLKTYPHLTQKSLVAFSGLDCHCLTVKTRIGMGDDGVFQVSICFNMLKTKDALPF